MANVFDTFFKNEENNEVINGGRLSSELGLVIRRPLAYGAETMEITDLVKKGKIVAFTLENLSSEDAIRTYDYITGATNVLGGKVEKITDKVFVSIPSGIKVEENVTKEERKEE